MRFGKRLSELVSQNNQAQQPYVSYKELKHLLSELMSLARKASNSTEAPADAADSSGDDSAGPEREAADVEVQQQRFFRQIDVDLAMVFSHIRSTLAALEVGVGSWQCEAAACGLMFTPSQLEEVSASLNFEVQDQQTLVQWLVGLQQPDQVRAAREVLVERYGQTSAALHSLLQYIEVNATAVRKILKKFDKKVPAELRVQSAQSYTAHHELFKQETLDLMLAVAQMHRLVLDLRAADPALGAGAGPASPVSFVGPESLQMLQRMRPHAFHSFLGQPGVRGIDVYAKPSVDISGARTGASKAGNANGSKRIGSTGALSALDGDQGQPQGSSAASVSQQAAVNIQRAELFQGPPKSSSTQRGSVPGGQDVARAKAGADTAPPNSTTNPMVGRGGQAGRGAGPKGGRRGRGGRGGRGQVGAAGRDAWHGRVPHEGAYAAEPPGDFGPSGGPDRSTMPFSGTSGGGRTDRLYHTQHPGGMVANAAMGNNMMMPAGMMMMMPAGFGQPGSFNVADGRGRKGGESAHALTMGMVPHMHPNFMYAWNGPIPQNVPLHVSLMGSAGYPQDAD